MKPIKSVAGKPNGEVAPVDIEADSVLPKPRLPTASPPMTSTAPTAPAATPERPGSRPAVPPAERLTRFFRAVIPWQTSRRHSPFETLARAHRGVHARPNLPLLHRAHAVAHRLHDGQVRRSGEPFITHPIAVATILADLGMDTTTLAAALLHDTVEDTSYTLSRLREDFGDEVAHLVDGVTKLDKVFFGESAEVETIRKMIIAAGRDVRVLVIKLADRLHNMRTLKFKSRASQLRTARATRDVLVPLADRLGIHVFKRELEDLVLATLEPDAYQKIDKYLTDREDRSTTLLMVISRLRNALRNHRVTASITERPRHHWSIYTDMRKSPVAEPYDPLRLVVHVSGPPTDCYAALGAVHEVYRPAPGRFKDFIAAPKFNLYQSLHTTVIGPDSEPLEVLLRTAEMHQVAEYGIVAHYRKSDNVTPGTRGGELQWLRRLLDWQSETIEASEFLASLRCDLAYGQIQVFTPRGDQLSLPSEATPVDVAYSLSTTTGDRLIGAYVNGRLAPVTATLEDGDVVEIITACGAYYPGPSRQWLESTKTATAKIQINQWFAGRDGADGAALAKKIAEGRLAIGLALRQHERALGDDTPVVTLARRLGYPDADALFVAVTECRLSAEDVAERLIASVDQT